MPLSSRTSVTAGAFLTIGMRWTDRLIGFASTLILARLLAPDDFGIIAMASLIVALVDVLLDMGANTVLIQYREPTQAHYDTAWTLRLAQAVLAALVVFLSAPFVATYFNDSRVEPVLCVMAAGLLIAGAENIGIVTFQKEMRFGMDFRFTFAKRIFGFIATMLAAWLLRSYWALVIGTLALRTSGLLLSYHMHPMRPRISLEKLNEIFGVSQWVFLNNIGNFLNNNLHKTLVGRHTSSATMGGYTLADEISSMPTTELLAPLNRVLFPAFVEARHDLTELKRIFLLAQGVQTLIAIPASIGLALVAHEAVIVLLGEKWTFAVPFIQILALANVVQAITTSGWYVMLTMGKARNLATITWLQVIAFVVSAIWLSASLDATLIAWIRVLTVLAGLVAAVWILKTTLTNVSLIDYGRTIFRPIVCTGLMALAVNEVNEFFYLSSLEMLIIKSGTGLLVYPIAILTLWVAAGKPTGPEDYILRKFVKSSAR